MKKVKERVEREILSKQRGKAAQGEEAGKQEAKAKKNEEKLLFAMRFPTKKGVPC